MRSDAAHVSILLAAWITLPASAKHALWVTGEPWLWKAISVAVVSAGAWAVLIARPGGGSLRPVGTTGTKSGPLA